MRRKHRHDRPPKRAPSASYSAMSVPIAPGPVVGSLCTGYGGLDLGVLAALRGGRIAWCADPDPHVATILTARMPDVPNFGDLRTVDWTQVEPVDVLTAGFPCQDISAAGRRAGIEKGERSGLWTDIVAALRLLRPALLVVENVAALRWKTGGLHRVLGDLAEAGYDAIWRSVRAADIGAAHRRERLFLLGWPQPTGHHDAAHPDRARRKLQRSQRRHQTGWPHPARASTSPSDTPTIGLPLDHDPHRVHPRTLNTHQLPDLDRVDAAAAHPDRLGRENLHTADPAWWTLALRRSPATAHIASLRHGDRESPVGDGGPAALTATGASHKGPRGVVPDPAGDRRHEGRPGATGLQGRPHAALGDHPPTDPTGQGPHLLAVGNPHEDGSPTARAGGRSADWGTYTAAVTRWEQVLGRRAPCPTQPGRHGRPVLSPAFVEHLMGLPPGWVTDLPLPRTAQLRALGNGVVPQQAAYAVSLLLADLTMLTTAAERPDVGQEANAA